ncbi:MAG: enoyl-CoA hydratase/isomerase family protein, partial [Acidimicrobiales bacterium]
MEYRRRVDELLYGSSAGICRITINRPDQRNAMSAEVIDGLRAGLGRAKQDPAVRVVVLAGQGDKAFCSGADLGGMGAADADLASVHDRRGDLARVFEELWQLGKPTIARVQG